MREIFGVKVLGLGLRIKGFSRIVIGESKVADTLFFSPLTNLENLWIRNLGSSLVFRPQREDIAEEHMTYRVEVTPADEVMDASLATSDQELAIWVPCGIDLGVFGYTQIDAIQARLGSVWTTTDRKSTGNFLFLTSLFATIPAHSSLCLNNFQGGQLIVSVNEGSRLEITDPESTFQSISARVEEHGKLSTAGTVLGNYTVVGSGERKHAGAIKGTIVGA